MCIELVPASFHLPNLGDIGTGLGTRGMKSLVESEVSWHWLQTIPNPGMSTCVLCSLVLLGLTKEVTTSEAKGPQ